MSNKSPTNHRGEPSTPERGADGPLSKNEARIIEPPSLFLPPVRNSEAPSNSRYNAIPTPVDEEIARAWIASAPGHQNVSSQGGSQEGQTGQLDNFQDEYEGPVKRNSKRISLKSLRTNLFSSSVVRTRLQSGHENSEQTTTLGWRNESLFRPQDEEAGRVHIEDNQFDSENNADSPPCNSMPSTPPSTELDFMHLSDKSNSSDQESKSRNNDAIRYKLRGNDTTSSFQAVASPGEIEELPFDWMRSPQETIPGEIVLDDDQQPNIEDELLTGDDDEAQSTSIDNNNELFRPPTLGGAVSRPSPIRGGDRQVTPQSWHSPISRARIHRTTSGGSSRRTTSAPLSPTSRRSTKSEKYFHSYQTNLEAPPNPVPPFVVVHNSGSAVVTVTPKHTTPMQGTTKNPKYRAKKKNARTVQEEESIESGKEANCACDGEDAKVWCRIWGRPVTCALASAAFALALVTVITSLVANRYQGTQSQLRPQTQVPTLDPTLDPTLGPTLDPTQSPVGLSINDFPEFGLDANGTLFDLDPPLDGLVLRPYEGTENPAEAPTLPPRTFSPTTRDETLIPTFAPSMLPENFPDFAPTRMPILDNDNDDDDDDDFNDGGTTFQVPWNNYVIGLLSVESPATFASFADATSPQFLALQWISVAASRKGGSVAYTMDGSLQRFALATIYFSLGGVDGLGWRKDGNWLSTVVPLCEWEGVGCDSTDTAILSLDLPSNNLSGTLPEELKLLKYLQILNLPNNAIAGSLPPEYSTLYDLREFNLSENSLTGTIPDEYGGAGVFELLEVLDIRQNTIEGSIPSQLGNLRSLERIQMCSNRITGPVPSEICNSNADLAFAFDCSIRCECCTSCCRS